MLCLPLPNSTTHKHRRWEKEAQLIALPHVTVFETRLYSHKLGATAFGWHRHRVTWLHSIHNKTPVLPWGSHPHNQHSFGIQGGGVSFITRRRLVIRHRLPLPWPVGTREDVRKWQIDGQCQSPALYHATRTLTCLLFHLPSSHYVCVSLSLSAVSVLAFTDPAQLYTVWQVDGESERDGAKIETEQ